MLLAAVYLWTSNMFGSEGISALVRRWFGLMSVRRLYERAGELDYHLFSYPEETRLLMCVVASLVFQWLILATILESGSDRGRRSIVKQWVGLPIVLAVAYFVVPDHAGPYVGYIAVRLGFLSPLLALPLLRLPSKGPYRKLSLGLVYAATLVHVVVVTLFVVDANKEIDEYVAAKDVVGSDSTIFVVKPPQGDRFPDYLKHASCYYCLDHGNVALENYQAQTGQFWIRFGEGVALAKGDLSAYPNREQVDVVLVWGTHPETIPQLVGCSEIFRRGRLRVFMNTER
jgi:hypothetical protein